MTRLKPRTLLLFALVATAALGLAACGSDEDLDATSDTVAGETTAPPPATTAPDDPPSTAESDPPDTTAPPETTTTDEGTAESVTGIAYDTSPDAVVLRLATGGGFVPMEIGFLEVPQLVVYGDGRVITADPAAQQVDFANLPATSPLVERTLDEDGMQALLLAAQEHGLLEGTSPDYGQPNVTDVPGTSLSIAANGVDANHSAYALGFDDPAAGLTEEQVAARKELGAFIEQALDLDTLAAGHVTPAEPYVAEQYDVRRFEVVDDPAAGSEVERQPWPEAAGDPPAKDGCTTVSGSEAAAIGEAFANAGINDRWTLSGVEFRAAARPILPGESTTC
jgi:hypothetical protein